MNDERLHEIAKTLEPHLPSWTLEWDPENRPHYALFVNEFGAGMFIGWCSGGNRLGVHGRYNPSYYPAPGKNPSITISAIRPAESIAADIRRRFLPEYLQVFAQMQKHQRLAEERKRQEDAVLAELAEILGERIGNDRTIRHSCAQDEHYAYGRIEVSGDQVDLNFSGLSIDTARAICNLLREASDETARIHPKMD